MKIKTAKYKQNLERVYELEGKMNVLYKQYAVRNREKNNRGKWTAGDGW